MRPDQDGQSDTTIRIGSEWGRQREQPPAALLGRFPLAGPLGSGGMGEVLLAHDPELGRELAIKVVRGEAGGLLLEKFVQEARITSQLAHPNIVPVHELGRTPDGRIYLAMKRVAGQDLAALLRGGADDLRALIGILLKVCDAVAYAHHRGVIHRDLKPANVMVGEFGEVLVLDWGLAKVLDRPEPGRTAPAVDAGSRAQQTLNGQVLGTPAYMAPEQARGEIERLDARTDVFALGAMLYEMLARVPPYEGSSAAAVLELAARGQPAPPRRRAPHRTIPHALESIARKAMAVDPAVRYPSAGALREELEAYLDDRPVAAARYGLVERAARAVRRHPTLTLAATLILVFGAIGGAAGTMLVSARRKAELQALASAGKIDELVAELGGQRRQQRDEAIGGFIRRYQEQARSRHLRIEEFARELGPAELRRIGQAFDRLFAAHARYGARVPLQADDHFYRGLLRHLQGDLDTAIADYGRALRLAPDQARALANRGLIWRSKGRPDRAFADFQRAAELLPDNPTLRTNLGNARRERGDLAGAIADYDHALARRPDSPGTLRSRGSTRRARGDLDGALADLDHALRLRPDDPLALLDRALTRRARGELELARADLDRALRLRPDYPEALLARALVRHARGETGGAIADLDQALRLQPERVELLSTRGSMRQMRGDTPARWPTSTARSPCSRTTPRRWPTAAPSAG